MTKINLLLGTTNDEQRGPDTSPEKTYQTVLRGTLDIVDEAQVLLPDLPLDPSTIKIVVHHHIVDKCSRLSL